MNQSVDGGYGHDRVFEQLVVKCGSVLVSTSGNPILNPELGSPR
jgi:hypothetical protein